MTRLTALTAIAAAALLLITAAPAQAIPDAVAGPSALSATQGTVAGTIDAVAGDHTFIMTWVPITGSAGPTIKTVTTSGSDVISSFAMAPGAYHVLVRSQSGNSRAAWFGGGMPYEVQASRVTVTAGATTTVHWTMLGSPSTFTGTIPSVAGTTTFTVGAYAYDLGIPTDRHPVAEVKVTDGSSWSLKGLSAGNFDIVIRDTSTLKFGTVVLTDFISASQIKSTDPIALATYPGNKPVRDRLAGANRYETAVEIASNTFDNNTDTVFIVSGENYPDALSAGPAARWEQAPVLLVKPNSIPEVVKQRLADWELYHIYIIGGTGAVSAAVETQLAAYGHDAPVRISGQDRYDTSRKVAEYFDLNDSTYYLANGQNFPDALGAGPAAMLRKGAVILVKGSAPTLDAATKTLIDAASPTFPVQIAGGTGSVSQGIDDAIAPLTQSHRRRAGLDRYATAARIVDASFAHANTIYLATGENFPDALAGGAAAGSDIAPILLVRHNCIPQAAWAQITRLRPNKIYVLGGTGVISDAVKVDLTVCST